MTLKTPPRSKGRSISCPAGPSQPHHFQGRNLHVSTTGTECGPRPDRFLSLRRQTQNLPQPGAPLALRFPALVLVSWGSCNYGPRLKTADTTDLKVLEARTWNSGHPQGRARSAGSEEGGLPASSSSWGRPACGCTPPISSSPGVSVFIRCPFLARRQSLDGGRPYSSVTTWLLLNFAMMLFLNKVTF